MSSSRTPLIAGNWKMNLTRASSLALAAEIKKYALENPPIDIAVYPPFVYLSAVLEALSASSVGVGAQNLFHHDEGAFTGEISGPMLRDLGCTTVIVGHSERRHVFKENNDWVAEKVRAAMDNNLNPILCIGETLDQWEAGLTFKVIEEQVTSALEGMGEEYAGRVTIAYEPVWAIGTGKNATPPQAQKVHKWVRGWLKNVFGEEIAEKTRILYGGSVKPDNAESLLAESQIDGFLIGGASLSAEKFLKICAVACEKGKLTKK